MIQFFDQSAALQAHQRQAAGRPYFISVERDRPVPPKCARPPKGKVHQALMERFAAGDLVSSAGVVAATGLSKSAINTTLIRMALAGVILRVDRGQYRLRVGAWA